MILSGTGSRSLALESKHYQGQILDMVVALIERFEPDVIYSGGAEGFDACIARAALLVGVPYELWLPNEEYLDFYWAKHSVTGTDRSVMKDMMVVSAQAIHYVGQPGQTHGEMPCTGAKHTHINFIRNHYLLSGADHALVYEPTTVPTEQGLEELARHGVPYTMVMRPTTHLVPSF